MSQTIADAINSVTEEEIAAEETEETAEEETAEPEEEEGSILDELDEEEGEEEEPTEEAEVEEEPEETEEEETTLDDPFEALSAEELAEIKKNPAANKLRKALMRAYNDKTSKHAQLVQLGNAYRNDPEGVLKAIAQSLGMTVVKEQQVQKQEAPAEQDPGKELEELFGDQIGPKVRAVFDKWAEARFGKRLQPLEQSLQQTAQERYYARMAGAEAGFKSKHKDITPDVEKEIIELGNSGKIVPGKGATPEEFLETLYEVVMSRRARQSMKKQVVTASSKLAKRIEANRMDREPSGVSGRAGAVKKVSKINNARSISEALDIALEELENEE